MNIVLQSLYVADQADRQSAQYFEKNYLEIGKRDKNRRHQVAQMIKSRELVDAIDFYHAAMVYQHGDTPNDYKKAHKLAKTSMDMGYHPARWLFAASLDRYLFSQGKPQKFGTQYQFDENGNEIYFPIDPSTTDQERKLYDVPIKKRFEKQI